MCKMIDPNSPPFCFPGRKIIYLLFSLSYLLHSNNYGQNHNSDYIMTSQGDTLYGNIREISNQRIRFRAKHTAKPIEYNADSIEMYQIDGIRRYARLLETNAWQKRPRKLFLKERIRGYLELYQLPKPDDYIEDFEFVIFVPKHGYLPLVGKHAWGTLKIHLTECEQTWINDKLDDQYFRYSLNYFRDIITKYNLCVEPHREQVYFSSKFLLEIGGFLGYTINSWNYQGESHPIRLPLNGKLPRKEIVNFGILLNLHSHRPWSLSLEAAYNRFQGDRTIPIFNSFGELVREYSLMVDHHIVRIPLNIKYYLRRKGIRPFLSLGPTLNFDLSILVRRTSKNPPPFDAVRFTNFNIGQIGGVGIDFPLHDHWLTFQTRYFSQVVQDEVVTVGMFSGLEFSLGYLTNIR